MKRVNRKANRKNLATKFKSVDIIFVIATTFTLVTLSFTWFGLVITPLSSGVACGLSSINGVILEPVISKFNDNKSFSGEQQKHKAFDKMCRKRLHNILLDIRRLDSF